MSDPGVNYLIRDHASLLMAGRLAICTATDCIFDTQPVRLVRRPRYAKGGVIPPGQKLEDLYRIDNGYIIPVRRSKPSKDDLS
jgi:hypothetical protein